MVNFSLNPILVGTLLSAGRATDMKGGFKNCTRNSLKPIMVTSQSNLGIIEDDVRMELGIIHNLSIRIRPSNHDVPEGVVRGEVGM